MLLVVMIVAAVAGIAALNLISQELAGRAGLTGPGRILLSAGLGMGVIVVSLKVFLVGYLMEKTRDNHPDLGARLTLSAPVLSDRHLESTLTGMWHALPAELPTPDRRPLRPEIVRLGQRLFNEKALSANGKVACSSCHRLEAGGDDNARFSTGIDGLHGKRNAPTFVNAAYLSRLFWDGRAASLEDQAAGPLTNPVEMGMASLSAVEAAVRALPGYADDFANAFGTRQAVTADNILHAIASYERTAVSPDTAYDRFVRGETGALTTRQIRGMALFAGLGCRTCHRDPTFSAAGKIRPAGVFKPFPIFSDNAYVRRYDLMSDKGAADAERQGAGLWRVPSLRNVADTAPYFHNGSVATLEEAIRVMVVTQLRRPLAGTNDRKPPAILWDVETRTLTPYRPSVVSQDDIEALAAFLKGLSAAGNGILLPVTSRRDDAMPPHRE